METPTPTPAPAPHPSLWHRKLFFVLAASLLMFVLGALALFYARPTTPTPTVRKATPVKAKKAVVAPAPTVKQSQSPRVIIHNYNVQNSPTPVQPTLDASSVVIHNYNIQGSAAPQEAPAPVPQPIPAPSVQMPALQPIPAPPPAATPPAVPSMEERSQPPQAGFVRPPTKVVNVLSGNTFQLNVLSGNGSWNGGARYGYGYAPPPIYQQASGAYGYTPGVLVCDRYQGCTWR